MFKRVDVIDKYKDTHKVLIWDNGSWSFPLYTSSGAERLSNDSVYSESWKKQSKIDELTKRIKELELMLLPDITFIITFRSSASSLMNNTGKHFIGKKIEQNDGKLNIVACVDGKLTTIAKFNENDVLLVETQIIE